MNVLPFSFDGSPVRVLEVGNEPWFVAKDVALALGYGNPQDAVRRHCKKAQDVGGAGITHPSDLDTQTRIIPEGDVYRLIVRSNLPSAERFEALVMDEILPSIRKTGSYGAAPQADLSDPAVLTTLLIEHATKRIEAEKRATSAEAQVEVSKPKAEFFDQFMDADGLYGLQNAGRVLNEPPNGFVAWLRKEYLFCQGTYLVPRKIYSDQGLFVVKATTWNGKARPRTYVTPKGLRYLAKKLGKQIERDLFSPQ